MGTTLTYNAYLQPWQATTSMPRLEPGVVRMATISGGGSRLVHHRAQGRRR
jgi:hypothetical protein